MMLAEKVNGPTAYFHLFFWGICWNYRSQRTNYPSFQLAGSTHCLARQKMIKVWTSTNSLLPKSLLWLRIASHYKDQLQRWAKAHWLVQMKCQVSPMKPYNHSMHICFIWRRKIGICFLSLIYVDQLYEAIRRICSTLSVQKQ